MMINYNENLFDVLPRIEDEKYQLIIADPPYFKVSKEKWDNFLETEEQYRLWCRSWISEISKKLTNDGVLCVFGMLGKRESVFLDVMSNARHILTYHDLIIWDRKVGYAERSDSYNNAYEMILILRKGDKVKFNKDIVREPYDEATIQTYLKDKRYKDKERRENELRKGKKATNIWRIPSLKGCFKEKVGHPTQKPEELVERLVLSYTDEGDYVLDPFAGVFSVSAVCKKKKRHCTSIEMNTEYFNKGIERIGKIL